MRLLHPWIFNDWNLYYTKITKNLTDAEIAELLRGNYCRCTGYTPIINAIKHSLSKGSNLWK